jgi:hypothetical protein
MPRVLRAPVHHGPTVLDFRLSPLNRRGRFLTIDRRFAFVPAWLVASNKVADFALRLFAHIRVRHEDWSTHSCSPTRRALAHELNRSLSTIDVALVQLKDAGALTVQERRDASGNQLPNLYTVIENRATSGGGATEKSGGGATEKSVTNVPDPLMPPFPSGVNVSGERPKQQKHPQAHAPAGTYVSKTARPPGNCWGTPGLIDTVCYEVITDACIIYDELEEICRRLKERHIDHNYGDVAKRLKLVKRRHLRSKAS